MLECTPAESMLPASPWQDERGEIVMTQFRRQATLLGRDIASAIGWLGAIGGEAAFGSLEPVHRKHSAFTLAIVEIGYIAENLQ